AVVRSVQADNGNHPAAVFQIDTGFVTPGNPSVGAWLTYGLGTQNQSLPAFVALPDFRSIPFSGAEQWGSGYLPASYQGTVLRWKGEAIRDLKSPAGSSAEAEQSERELLRSFNHAYLETPLTNPDLQPHIDAHKNHLKNEQETHKPIAAFIKALKQRGLLDTTLLVWMGEFGRTPDTPADQKTKGRDHNPSGMSMWFAGGGIKGGTVVGAT